MKGAFVLCTTSLLVLGLATLAASFERRNHDRFGVNPFHFENVTRSLLQYIHRTSGAMLKTCNISIQNNPRVFMCLLEKYNENKDVTSEDPKTAFIAMMKLMNVSAECFSNVTNTQAMCLYEKKQEMVNTVKMRAMVLSKIADHILQSCSATPEIKNCVGLKVTELQQLADTMLNDPSIAEKIWELGSSLKTCLIEQRAIEKCVLDKKMMRPKTDGRKWHRKGERGGMQTRFEEKLRQVLDDCNVTDVHVSDVFTCLKEIYEKSENLSTQDHKQMFINSMKSIKAFTMCFQNLPNENKVCLWNKKTEMMNEKIMEMQTLMDELLSTCGVSESSTPGLSQCIEPKRSEIMTLLPQLLEGQLVASDLWDLMKSLKKCFESEPEIENCIKEQAKNHYMSKAGKGNWVKSKVNIVSKIIGAFKKCNISAETTPTIYDCLKPSFRKLRGLFFRMDIDAATKKQELQKIQEEGMKCFGNTDENMITCLKKESESLRSTFFNSDHKFDPKDMMERTDQMSAQCNITVEKTPSLKVCLDYITVAVMKIKPWLPMTDERREKLKLEGVKYWKCFGDEHKDEKKCMTKIIEGFSSKGKLGSSFYDQLIDTLKSKVLECSTNTCFREEVEKAANVFKEYTEEVQAKGSNVRISSKFRVHVVKALICIKNAPLAEVKKTFTCVDRVSVEMYNSLEKLSKLGLTQGLLGRKKRDADDADDDADDDDDDDDETNTGLPFFLILEEQEEGGTGNGQQSSVTVFQLLFNDKSMDRVNAMLNLMKTFISTCTDWAPPPTDMGRNQLFDMPDPVPKLNANYIQCKKMYDDINTFIDTGEEQRQYLNEREEDYDHDKHHVSTAVIVAAVTGGIIAGVFIMLLTVVVCVMKRRCSRHPNAPPTTLSPSPSAPMPSIYSTFPTKQQSVNEMPPSYHESLDEEKFQKSVAGLSQILDSSTDEGTEKSC